MAITQRQASLLVARVAGSYNCTGHDFRRSPPRGRPSFHGLPLSWFPTSGFRLLPSVFCLL